jgi:glycosyltransferase involved in cell wall biosynthesis
MCPRIIFLSGELSLGGGAIVVLNLCNGLRDSGHWQPVAAVFSRLGMIGDQIQASGHPIIGPFPNAVTHEDYVEMMFEACGSSTPAAIVANLGGDSFDFLRYVPDRVLRIGIIHSDDFHVYEMVNAYSAWIDVVVGVSEEICRKARTRLAGAPTKIVQIASGVPAPAQPRIRREDRELRVIYVGRIVEDAKRVSLMARVIRSSVAADKSIRWTLVGDGPDLPWMRRELSDLTDNVTFTGVMNYDQIPSILRQHDVFFLCSDYEGLPLSLIEAMGAGLAPVVSDLPSGISEAVNDANGIRVPVDREDLYVKALTDLAADPGQLVRLGQQAREDMLRNYSVQAMTSRWESLLANINDGADVTWKLHERVTIPPIMRYRWYFHPRLRSARRLLKLCAKRLHRSTKP